MRLGTPKTVGIEGIIGGEKPSLSQRENLGHIVFCLFPCFKPFEVAPDFHGMQFGLFPRGVVPENVAKSNSVEHRGFFDWTRGEGLVLALKKTESCSVHRGIGINRFCVLGLFPDLPEC